MARKLASPNTKALTIECMIATALRVEQVTMADLARELKVSRQMVSAVIRGTKRSKRIERYISDRFSIRNAAWGRAARKARVA